jgi:5-aminolevulinate synthase
LQPINFPTVNKGEEILRISPTPNHTQEMVDKLVYALKIVFERINIKKLSKLKNE